MYVCIRLVLENCPKKCPEGTDDECEDGMICYDLTGNEPTICKTEGFPVKRKADPNKRFCGDSYNHMMEFVSCQLHAGFAHRLLREKGLTVWHCLSLDSCTVSHALSKWRRGE